MDSYLRSWLLFPLRKLRVRLTSFRSTPGSNGRLNADYDFGSSILCRFEKSALTVGHTDSTFLEPI